MNTIDRTTLTKEQYDTLNESFLYKRPPVIDNSFSVGTTPGTYHCRNWTFKCHKKDGRAWMADTYFGDRYEEVTDENFDLYTKIFDFNEVKRISDYEQDEYEEKDLFIVATDSGGYSCGHLGWVKKDTRKSKDLLIKKALRDIERLKRHLESKERELRSLIDGTHYEVRLP